MIDRIFTLREEMRTLEKKITELNKEKTKIEDSLLADMDTQGVRSVSGRKATASVSENLVPSVEDWDSFHAWIRRNNAFYLLQRRANALPYRELMESRHGKKLPGVNTVTLRTLNLKARA